METPTRFTYVKPVTVGASGGTFAVLLVWAAEWAGAPLTEEVAAAMSALVVTSGALLINNGIRGIVGALWRGAEN